MFQNSKRKSVRAVLYVHGDGLRVVDDDTKGLIVDQTIEKVSFCAPDRNYDRGFSYICRDGTTRRWMCHAFMAARDTVRDTLNKQRDIKALVPSLSQIVKFEASVFGKFARSYSFWRKGRRKCFQGAICLQLQRQHDESYSTASAAQIRLGC